MSPLQQCCEAVEFKFFSGQITDLSLVSERVTHHRHLLISALL